GVAHPRLVLSPGFWAITAAAGLIQASHALFYGFSVLDWRAKGLDATSIGGLWGLAVVAEIVLFAVSARVLRRIGPLGLVGLGARAYAAMALAAGLGGAFALLARRFVPAEDDPLRSHKQSPQ